ncbi:MAG: hypothetical protein R3224_02665, partial [Balneolaceae bacterium]|nr:hypothetical protein [Balneolaceae bacterium]
FVPLQDFTMTVTTTVPIFQIDQNFRLIYANTPSMARRGDYKGRWFFCGGRAELRTARCMQKCKHCYGKLLHYCNSGGE